MWNDTERTPSGDAGTPAPPQVTDAARALARKRIEKRRGLQGGLVAYVVVNAAFVGIWVVTGGGYFWPGWILALWGVGMVLGIWDYLRRPISEDDVEAELRRMARRRRPLGE
ncbi:MAG: 2TM domain-containing protein [Acidobacteriota bacterium]|nr:2TM domain-containing protein [Acidobacteriota bacterium]